VLPVVKKSISVIPQYAQQEIDDFQLLIFDFVRRGTINSKWPKVGKFR
jgi:hypothetical protein